jgi:hypothetical protein
VRREDQEAVRCALEAASMTSVEDAKKLRSVSGVAVKPLLAGETVGKDSDVRLPDPGDSQTITHIEGLPVLTLARLIESKIACGEGNLRRTHKDFADVVELIARRRLGRDFARHLHKSLRATFRQLLLQARAE